MIKNNFGVDHYVLFRVMAKKKAKKKKSKLLTCRKTIFMLNLGSCSLLPLSQPKNTARNCI